MGVSISSMQQSVALTSSSPKHAVSIMYEHDLRGVDRHSASPTQMRFPHSLARSCSGVSSRLGSAAGQRDTIEEPPIFVVTKQTSSTDSLSRDAMIDRHGVFGPWSAAFPSSGRRARLRLTDRDWRGADLLHCSLLLAPVRQRRLLWYSMPGEKEGGETKQPFR